MGHAPPPSHSRRMRLRQTLLALTLLFAGACASGQGDTADNPIRIVRPTREDIMREYPPDALARGVSGSATVECEIIRAGLLDHCSILTEDPPGEGFGDAAIRVAFEHYARPDTEGRFAVGRKVRVPIQFTPPR
jgi:protein TonB